MLRRYLGQRHIDLDNGRSCRALEREYWQALEVLSYEDGWNSWCRYRSGVFRSLICGTICVVALSVLASIASFDFRESAFSKIARYFNGLDEGHKRSIQIKKSNPWPVASSNLVYRSKSLIVPSDTTFELP